MSWEAPLLQVHPQTCQRAPWLRAAVLPGDAAGPEPITKQLLEEEAAPRPSGPLTEELKRSCWEPLVERRTGNPGGGRETQSRLGEAGREEDHLLQRPPEVRELRPRTAAHVHPVGTEAAEGTEQGAPAWEQTTWAGPPALPRLEHDLGRGPPLH